MLDIIYGGPVAVDIVFMFCIFMRLYTVAVDIVSMFRIFLRLYMVAVDIVFMFRIFLSEIKACRKFPALCLLFNVGFSCSSFIV